MPIRKVSEWRPIPNSTQELAIDTRADQTLFCGTRGCGKTASQLALFRRMAANSDDHCIGMIIDTDYKSLDNLIQHAHRMFRGAGRFKSSRADYYWLFPTGARLFFRALRSVDACKTYLGDDISFLGFNELTKYPNLDVYNTMMGSLRTSTAAGLKTKVFSTTNPFGVGKLAVKRKFIDTVPYGVPYIDKVEIPWIDDKVHIQEKSIISLRGNYAENPFFSKDDIANLLQGVEGDPAKYAAWVLCDWDAAGGDGLFSNLWQRDVHVLPDFPIPHDWYIDRAFDWGSVTPFSIGWFARSNGDDVYHNGETISLPRGSVVQFAEWYGCPKDRDGRLAIGTNKGLEKTPRDIAYGIKNRERKWLASGMIKGSVKAGAADTQINSRVRADIATIAKTMGSYGVHWLPCYKASGSVIQGIQAIRNGLQNALKRDHNGFYVQRKCQATIETLPFLEKEDEDIAPDQEDHAFDMIRYRLLKRGATKTADISFPRAHRFGS